MSDVFAGLSLTGAPASEPVTVADMVDHLRLPDSSESSYVSALISAARKHIESTYGVAMITQTWAQTLDCWPCGAVKLLRYPVQSVESVTYRDEDGESQTWSSDEYIVGTASRPARIALRSGYDYPTTDGEIEAATVAFTAGFGDADDVPADLKHAIKLYVAHLYENREPVNIGNIVTPLPMHIDALLADYKMWVF